MSDTPKRGRGSREGANRPGSMVRKIPEGDNRLRLVCPDCGYIAYENPKVVVGSVATLGGKILLCKREIGRINSRYCRQILV